MQHNIPLAFKDYLIPLMKDIFPDSEIARNYASASTKTTCMINCSLAPYFKAALVGTMKSSSFAFAIGRSNDTGLQKMNPITIRFFDKRQAMIITRFIDMCITEGTL